MPNNPGVNKIAKKITLALVPKYTSIFVKISSLHLLEIVVITDDKSKKMEAISGKNCLTSRD